ncbi:FecCD family ABC transporter permease [Timonella sp. A28]|uniref:FecCD family ABC transporter permease n=1 Tax=Timonella sp. A28 TaxID=3442640 RepID=UPI003EB893D4
MTRTDQQHHITRTLRNRLRARTLIACTVFALLLTALFVTTLLLGEAGLTAQEVLEAFTGQASSVVQFVVLELRLPRALAAALVGICLGTAGAIFQSVLRNPLASPDIIGITAGSATAGIISVLLFHLSGLPLMLVVVAGGILTSALVAALAWRSGLHGFKLVLIGIGVAAVCTAITSYMMTKVELRDASLAYTWLTGSLASVNSTTVTVAGIGAAACLVVLAFTHRTLRALELGDNTALGLGFHVKRDRLVMLALGVVLTALAVGVSGPIAFVALMAPHIARNLVGGTSLSLVASAAVGGTLVSGADLIAQYILPGTPLPVGVVTGALGAPYLAWLLTRSASSKLGASA